MRNEIPYSGITSIDPVLENPEVPGVHAKLPYFIN
jgi:hypothetical protein